jgi:phosphoserine phosphatase
VAGPNKSRLIANHARDHGHELAECFGYSDSYSDVPMLSVVGRPAVINPDPRLLRLARTYQWPIIELR